MTTSTTYWNTPEPVVRQLATREGFEKAVVPASGVTKALKGLLILSAVFLAFNIFSTVQSLNKFKAAAPGFFEVFFSIIGEDGEVNPKLVFMVWGPVVMIPIALILLVVSMTTRNGRYESAFANFSSGGYVAVALGLPIPFLIGRDQFVPQVIVPGPNSTPQVTYWFDGLTAMIQNMDKAGSKQLVKALARTLKKDDVAVPATAVFPDAPPFALLVRASNSVGAQTVRAVVPGNGDVRAHVVDLTKIQGWG